MCEPNKNRGRTASINFFDYTRFPLFAGCSIENPFNLNPPTVAIWQRLPKISILI